MNALLPLGVPLTGGRGRITILEGIEKEGIIPDDATVISRIIAGALREKEEEGDQEGRVTGETGRRVGWNMAIGNGFMCCSSVCF